MNRKVRELVYSDLGRLSNNLGIKAYLKWRFFTPGSTFPYHISLRKLHYYKKHKVLKYTIGLIEYLRFRHLTYKFGINTNANISIGNGFSIVHGGSGFR